MNADKTTDCKQTSYAVVKRRQASCSGISLLLVTGQLTLPGGDRFLSTSQMASGAVFLGACLGATHQRAVGRQNI